MQIQINTKNGNMLKGIKLLGLHNASALNIMKVMRDSHDFVVSNPNDFWLLIINEDSPVDFSFVLIVKSEIESIIFKGI